LVYNPHTVDITSIHQPQLLVYNPHEYFSYKYHNPQ
jgi:hypothetical protein